MQQMPLEELIAAVEAQRESYLRGEPSSQECALELLRRAISEHDDAAWEAVIQQFGGMIRAKIRRHPARASVSGDEDYWLNLTFERFAAAVSSEKLAGFSDLPAVLRYMAMCAHSVMMDELRCRRRRRETSLDEVPDDLILESDVERAVLSELAASELWDAVMQEIADPQEGIVARLSFVRGYKPAEIHAEHPESFPTIHHVYRAKRNLVDRLRKSARLQGLVNNSV